MKWTRETFEGKRKRLLKWSRWFAWYPVEIGADLRNSDQPLVQVWLSFVYRSQDAHWNEVWKMWVWTTYYREIPEVPHTTTER